MSLLSEQIGPGQQVVPTFLLLLEHEQYLRLLMCILHRPVLNLAASRSEQQVTTYAGCPSVQPSPGA